MDKTIISVVSLGLQFSVTHLLFHRFPWFLPSTARPKMSIESSYLSGIQGCNGGRDTISCYVLVTVTDEMNSFHHANNSLKEVLLISGGANI